MKILKQNLYEFIRNQVQEDTYIGLHGIADSSDLINQYSHLSKDDKARSIVERGLINGRGTTISLTVRNFGNLNIFDQEKIKLFNNYCFYSPSGYQVIIVVAIPYFFEDSQGRKLFGGYKEYPTPKPYIFNNIPECITDYIFRNKIPPEMILGYYSYHNKDEYVEYKENPYYFSKLFQYQKDEFIQKNLTGSFCYDVNDIEMVEHTKRVCEILGSIMENNSPIINTVLQYEKLQTINKVKKS